MWQQAVERRIPSLISREDHKAIRPVFLWADESQFFVSSYDAQFQGTARSSRACTVYLTQNLPNYFSFIGDQNARTETEASLGNLQTKIFHANGDPATNNWAADMIDCGNFGFVSLNQATWSSQSADDVGNQDDS